MTVTDKESRADLRQATLLMQAGINSSLAGADDDALPLFEAAQQRFTKLRMTWEAGIARAWINGLTRLHSHHTHAEHLPSG